VSGRVTLGPVWPPVWALYRCGLCDLRVAVCVGLVWSLMLLLSVKPLSSSIEYTFLTFLAATPLPRTDCDDPLSQKWNQNRPYFDRICSIPPEMVPHVVPS
jgi:hypothetical protein